MTFLNFFSFFSRSRGTFCKATFRFIKKNIVLFQQGLKAKIHKPKKNKFRFMPQFCMLKMFEGKKLNQIKSNLNIRKCPQKMTRTANFGLGTPQRMFLVFFPNVFFSK